MALQLSGYVLGNSILVSFPMHFQVSMENTALGTGNTSQPLIHLEFNSMVVQSPHTLYTVAVICSITLGMAMQLSPATVIGPRHEKTCLSGFRQSEI